MSAYSILEAAHYLSLPASTVRWWAIGRDHYPALIDPAVVHGSTVLLSFFNLVEIHVLSVIRRRHGVKMRKVRDALTFLKDQMNVAKHPLIRQRMLTDGVDLFVERLGELTNISQGGQQEMQEMIRRALERIEWETDGLPLKLYPFTRSELSRSPQLVVIDPRLSGGRPVIAGTGVAIEVIVDRYKAGDSIRALARDYGCRADAIEEAVRCELPHAHAA